MKYLSQAFLAWLVDWFLDRCLPLKAKTAAAWKTLRSRNTGDK